MTSESATASAIVDYIKSGELNVFVSEETQRNLDIICLIAKVNNEITIERACEFALRRKRMRSY